MKRPDLAVALLAVLFAVPLGATDVNRADVVRITSNIVCTCGCPPTLVSACSCDRAGEITREVEALLAAGKTEEEIFKRYTDEFGAQVLAAPKAEGFNLLGWVFPFVALLAGGGIVVLAYRRLRVAEAPAQSTSKTAEIDSKYKELLERELAE